MCVCVCVWVGMHACVHACILLLSSCVHFYELIHYVAQEEKSGTSLYCTVSVLLAFISKTNFSILHPW